MQLTDPERELRSSPGAPTGSWRAHRIGKGDDAPPTTSPQEWWCSIIGHGGVKSNLDMEIGTICVWHGHIVVVVVVVQDFGKCFWTVTTSIPSRPSRASWKWIKSELLPAGEVLLAGVWSTGEKLNRAGHARQLAVDARKMEHGVPLWGLGKCNLGRLGIAFGGLWLPVPEAQKSSRIWLFTCP